MPPISVYPPITTARSIAASSGLRSATRLLRTAVAATVRDIMTIKLVKKAKVQKTGWVRAPNRALITWRKVFAPGALVFSMMERMENMMIWMVADQVHWETMVVAVKPIETLPPASKA